MCLLFETLKAENGEIFNLEYHQRRVKRTFAALFPGVEPVNLEKITDGMNIPKNGLYRVRISYDADRTETETFPYVRRNIKKLVLTEADGISYPFKYEDRTALAVYSRDLPADCEPLFTTNGRITDTTFSNVAFYNGEGWFTPYTFILPGTKREYYIENGFLRECEISVDDIKRYRTVSLINAMCDIGDIMLNVSAIEKGA